MIRFLFDAGSDAANARLLHYIKQDLTAGKKAVLLVPEQAAVATERRMLAALPPAAQLSFEVLNFTRLANRTFRSVGGLGYRYATPGVCSLLMWQTLKQLSPSLQLYGQAAGNDMRLCEGMLSALAQCSAYCVTPDALLNAADKLEESDPLAKKLLDIGSIYATYKKALSARFDDMDDDLTRAASLITAHPNLFADTVLYVDGFTDFTGQELALLRVLLTRTPDACLTLALCSRHDEGIHMASALSTYRTLWRMATDAGCEIAFEEPTHTKPTSAADYIRKHIFDMSAEQAPLGMREDISLVSCPNPYAEAEYAAALIAKLVREGCRYQDITVILRDASTERGIIDAALEKEGIPYFLSERTDITLRPLIKFILFALRIRLYGWRSEDVLGYLKTGLAGIASDDIGFFEEYISVWHLRGAASFSKPFTMNADGYRAEASPRGARILALAEAVRAAFVPPLQALFTALDDAPDTAARCRALDAFLRTSDIPGKLRAEAAERLVAGDRREAEELARLWSVTVSSIEEIAATLGEEKTPLSDFFDMLRLVFSATDMGTIPTSVDEVTVGSAATLRADRTRFVIALRLNEGVFPAKIGDKGLISDAEKRRLQALGIALSADNTTAASDELFYVRRALSLFTEKLYLTYTESGTDGKKATPSLAVDRIKRLFGIEKAIPLSDIPLKDRIFSIGAALDNLPELEAGQRLALLDLLQSNAETAETAACLGMPVVDTEAALSADEAAELFGSNAFNPTGLEAFVKCRFAYYCEKVLSLRAPISDAIGADVVGTFMHHILEHILADAGSRDRGYADYTPAEIETLVGDIVTDYRKMLAEAAGGLTPRADALLSRLATLARLVVTSLFAELADSRFTPAFLELDITSAGIASAIQGPEGQEIPLTGKIDRADVYRADDGTAYLRVVDYKTGHKKISLSDVAEGACLQMPLYLYALCKEKSPALLRRLGLPADTELKPAGVTYLSTAVGSETTSHILSEEEALQSAMGRIERTGLLLGKEEVLSAMSVKADKQIVGDRGNTKLIDEEFQALFGTLSNTVARISADMRAGRAQAHPRRQNGKLHCTYCPFGAVCRNKKRSD